MIHYCDKHDGKGPDCQTWSQCHNRGVCLATPLSLLEPVIDIEEAPVPKLEKHNAG